jgi:hypothetical protein
MMGASIPELSRTSSQEATDGPEITSEASAKG